MLSRVKRVLAEKYHHFKLLFRKEQYDAKVFCIGFNKTGTTTVGKSLELLGYRNSSFNKKVWSKYYKKGKIDKVIKYTAKFESFDDLPWLKEDMIPILDRTFPNSKFIYLEREAEDWKQSMETRSYKMTGSKRDGDKAYEKYLRHQEFIHKYFKDFPTDRFIKLNVNDPNAFEKLAVFLKKPIVQSAFPVYNKTSEFVKK